MTKFFSRIWDNILANLVVILFQTYWQSWGLGLVLASIVTYILQQAEQFPLAISIIVFCGVFTVIVILAQIFRENSKQPFAVEQTLVNVTPSLPPRLFYDEDDPTCFQRGGRVSGGGIVYDETIYRLGIHSETQIRGCRLVLAYAEPQPNNPGQQRIGLAMRPRIPTGSEEFTVNPGASAFVEVLQETVPIPNPLNQGSTIRLIYFNEDRGRANPFENGDYVLTFRLEGLMTPVTYNLAVNFNGQRWRVGSA